VICVTQAEEAEGEKRLTADSLKRKSTEIKRREYGECREELKAEGARPMRLKGPGAAMTKYREEFEQKKRGPARNAGVETSRRNYDCSRNAVRRQCSETKRSFL